jgi:branched-chain amino acid transport system ATP-binding protein
MLKLESVESGYGSAQVLFGLCLAVGAGEFVALLGRNGMGKTTAVRTIMGLLACRRGEIRFDGHLLVGRRPHEIARLGIGLVPEGRQIFPTLTVEGNLLATARADGPSPRWTLDKVFQLFPRLQERRHALGSRLSGGEQQMLAIGRALMTNPKCLILDEATEGLAPLVRAEIWACLDQLKHSGLSILMIDKHLDALSKIADRLVIVERGRTVWQGSSDDLRANPAAIERHLKV